jgi:NlpC/P60 family putative phage cell wall peptidase
MNETEARSAVVAEARRWLSTPYHHYAAVHGVGVDCARILIEVFANVGLIERFTPPPYPRDFMLHREDERYMGFITDRARPVERPEPGDVMLFRFGRCFSHGGIVTKAEPLTLVHAYAQARCVVEEEIGRNAQLAERAARAKFFSYWGA